MNKFVLLVAVASILSACGGASSSAPVPVATATPSSQWIWAFGTGVTPSQNATTLTIPALGGFSGRMLLPSGSGQALFRMASSPPNGIPTLTSSSATPALAYVTFTATSAFTLSAAPAFALTVPASAATAGTYALNEYTNGWSALPSVAWMLYSTNELCVQSQAPAISLQSGQSVTLAITGDFVLPTPAASPAPCPY